MTDKVDNCVLLQYKNLLILCKITLALPNLLDHYQKVINDRPSN